MQTSQSLTRVSSRQEDSELINVIVECPRGTRNKFKYDEELGIFRLSKLLPMGAVFPYDFGFVPSTESEDGDPLDILVVSDEATFPGCLITVRLLGVIEAEQVEKGKTTRNDRLVGIVEAPYNRPEIDSLEQLGSSRLQEIEHFFVSYNETEGRQFKPIGRHGPRKAEAIIAQGEQRFKQS